jgi:hypothetical protein
MLDQSICFLTRKVGGADQVVALRINGQDRLEIPMDSTIDIQHTAGGVPYAEVSLTLLASSISYAPEDA